MLILDNGCWWCEHEDMPTDPLAEFLHRAIGRQVAQRRSQIQPRMTQESLAALTDGVLSRSAIANIENGRQRIAVHHLFLIARALGVEPVELLPSQSELPGREILANRRISNDPSAREFTKLVLGDAATPSREASHEE